MRTTREPGLDRVTFAVHGRRFAGAAAAIAGLVFASTALWSLLLYTPIPAWDEWETIDLFREWRVSLDPSLLLSLHNEHRLGLARLLFFADYDVASGTGILSLTAIWVIQLLHGILLWRLYLTSGPDGTGKSPWQPASIIVLSSIVVLLFSARQLENLIWGFQVQFVGVYALATLSVWCLATATLNRDGTPRPRLRWIPFLAAIAASATASTTMASGLLVWPLVAALAFVWQAGRGVALFVCGASILAWTLYFTGYESPGHHGNPLLSLLRPDQMIAYVVMYLGAPFVPKKVVAWIPGIPLLLAMVGVIVLSATRWRHRLSRSEWVLIGVIAFVLGSAFLTAVGRVDIGIGQSSASRYTTPVHVGVAALALLALGRSEALLRVIGGRARWAIGGLLAFMAVFVLVNHVIYLDKRTGTHRGLALARSALIADVRDMEAYRGAFPDPTVVARKAPAYRDLGLAPFHDGLAERVGQLAPAGWRTGTEACSVRLLVAQAIADDPGGWRLVLDVSGGKSSFPVPRFRKTLWVIGPNDRVAGVAFPSLKPSLAGVIGKGGDVYEGHARTTETSGGLADGRVVLEVDGDALCVSDIR